MTITARPQKLTLVHVGDEWELHGTADSLLGVFATAARARAFAACFSPWLEIVDPDRRRSPR